MLEAWVTQFACTSESMRAHCSFDQLLLHGKSSLTWHLNDAQLQWQIPEKIFNHIADINDRCAGYYKIRCVKVTPHKALEDVVRNLSSITRLHADASRRQCNPSLPKRSA